MDEGIGQIRDLVIANDFADPEQTGDLTQRDITDQFVDHAVSLVNVDALRPMRIVVDAGNGMAGKIIPLVFERIPGELIPLYFELDGTFPNHPANPLEPENIRDLQQKVVDEKADLGIAFDGDADRMFLIDERGEFVGGDMVTAMVSKVMLEGYPGATIVYSLINSRTVPELIEREGGVPIRARVGHSFIKAVMREHDAVFGGEHSGHFYFRDNWYADSGLIAFLTILELLSNEGKTVSQVLTPIDTRFRSGELNFEVANGQRVMERLKDTYSDATIDDLDGLTFGYDTWWFNIRPSNTQPLLRLNIEAETKDELQQRVAEVSALIQQSSE